MMNIIGVHPIAADEPCHLVEVEFDEPSPDYDWGQLTQETPDQPKENWQAPLDERPLDKDGKRWAFFFHYLDFSRPLLTPDPVSIPQASELPEHLKSIQYEGH